MKSIDVWFAVKSTMEILHIPTLNLFVVFVTVCIGSELYKCQSLPDYVKTQPTISDYLKTPDKSLIKDASQYKPFEYPEDVDFRIIVLTYNRPLSLARCLDHVDHVKTDGANLRVEVWVDRHINGTVDIETLKLLNKIITKSHVIIRVHVHPQHAGLYGQWTRTWRPKSGSDEIVLYLEDDVDVSPYAYRWLRSAYNVYKDDPELSGISLQEEYMITAAGRRRGVSLKTPDYDPIYLYRIVGPWGFSPHPDHWRQFQDWFLSRDQDANPHVPDAGLYDSWYSDMERENRTTSMWIMWYICYCHHHDLYTAYANLRAYSRDPSAALVVNRREDGLHFRSRQKEDAGQFLLDHWDEKFVDFPEQITKLDFDGSFS